MSMHCPLRRYYGNGMGTIARGDFIRTVRPERSLGTRRVVAELCGIGFIKGTRLIIPPVQIGTR